MVLKLHIYKPLEHLATMLSESSSLQTLFSVPDAATALTRVLWGYAEDSAEYDLETGDLKPKDLPRCLIALEDFNSTKGTTSSWSTGIVMTVMIESLTIPADKLKSGSERYKAYLRSIEGVWDDVRESAAAGDRLNLTDIRTVIPPQRGDDANSLGAESWWSVFSVTAGG